MATVRRSYRARHRHGDPPGGELADWEKVSRPAIARIERGTNSTTLDRLSAIATVLRVPAEGLISAAVHSAAKYDSWA
ncbi:helix-turn-helix domain-containing protein [Gordonia sp. MP11Mi]|uniref:helix-turn-helix domain-containing protein n=1 Tax=Gordonia sp. MP11Mi TaxID=3022769 RepID=UPI003B22009B